MLSEETGKRRHGNLVPMRGCWAGNQNDAVLYQVSRSHCVGSGGVGVTLSLLQPGDPQKQTGKPLFFSLKKQHRSLVQCLFFSSLHCPVMTGSKEMTGEDRNLQRGSNFSGATDVGTVRRASTHFGKTIVFNPSPGSMAPLAAGSPPTLLSSLTFTSLSNYCIME